MHVRELKGAMEGRVRRVAAYCRVSTAMEIQEGSLEMQIAAYRAQIETEPGWMLAGIYADRGKSATGVKGRESFIRMMRAAESGEIDLILTKSISRFSRNLVDCQRSVQRLKERNVEVRFEKEQISSFDPGAEFVFSLMAAIAQDESRSISDNVKWTCRERFRRGDYCMGSNRILGYDCDRQTRKLVPNADAWMVCMAFELFLRGMGNGEIAARISAEGGRCMRSGKPVNSATVRRMLRNETYVGDKLLQKNPPKNYLTKKPDPNEAFVQYYRMEEHEAIIDRAAWNEAKAILDQQKALDDARGIRRRAREHHFLYGILYCGKCGANYTRRTFTARNGKGEKQLYKAWNCCERQKGKAGNGCDNPSVREDRILEAITRQMGWAQPDGERISRELKRARVLNGNIEIERAPTAATGSHIL